MSTRSESCEDLDDDQLFCRERGHWWRHVTDRSLILNTRKIPTRIERHSRCEHCSSELVEVFDLPSFELVRRKIDYSDGYLLIGNSGAARYRRADFRRERGYRTRLLNRRSA